MREIKLYQCSICNTQYADERVCRECEKNHKTKLKIFGAQHVAYKNNRKGWPVRIFVQDTDGIHKCGEGLYFCPFFCVNPCIRGEHYVPAGAVEHKKPQQKPAAVNKPVAQQEDVSDEPKIIPPFKPLIRKRNAVDWEKYHNEIFTRLNNGEPLGAIAGRLGIHPNVLKYYVCRY